MSPFFLLCTVGFEMWHLELITGLVVLISSSRYLLLRIWPDFAESTEAANRQVAQFVVVIVSVGDLFFLCNFCYKSLIIIK